MSNQDCVLLDIVSVFLSFVLIVLMVFQAHAHDAARPDLNDWFKNLKSSGHGACCDGSDAMHLTDVEWNTQDKANSHFRVRVPKDAAGFAASMKGEAVETEWVDVPDDAVILDEPNKAGMALVWPTYYYMGEVMIRCFMPGALT